MLFWMGFYVFLYIYIFSLKRNDLVVHFNFFWREMTSSWKLFLFIYLFSMIIWKRHDLVMYSIYYIQERDVSQENLYHVILVCKEKNIIVKILLNSCLMFELLYVIYKCFVFCVFGCFCLGKLAYWSLIIVLWDIRISITSV